MAKAFTEIGIEDSEAFAMVALVQGTLTVAQAKNDYGDDLNRYYQCLDEALPERDEVLLLAVARKYKLTEYADMIAVGSKFRGKCKLP